MQYDFATCVFIFESEERATIAHEVITLAFNSDGNLDNGFRIRTKQPSRFLSNENDRQPDQPWLIHEHRCVIARLDNLPEWFCSEKEPSTIIASGTPMIVGNDIRNYGLDGTRARGIKIASPTLSIKAFKACA